MKLYDNGVDRFEKELGVEKILRDLRNLKIYQNTVLLDDVAKYNIQHHKKNVIYIDSDDEKK